MSNDDVCSFCKKELSQVKKMIRAEGALICDQCAKKFRDTLASFKEGTDGLPKRTVESSDSFVPEAMPTRSSEV